VVLDPGHGGDDPGATRNGLREADLVLDLARRIEGRLTAIGVSVVYTRTESTCPSDEERAALANRAEADVLLSLHCDSHDHVDASGVASFFFGRDRRTAWSAVGEHLADLLQREIVARTGLANCRSHGRSWRLLQQTAMPAVRLEAGYLSHPEDAARLADPAFRDTLAEAVLVSLQRMYLGEDDTNATGVLRLGDLRAYLASGGAT
jgi:N-acetylmuramoyl-L-alanine amidase